MAVIVIVEEEQETFLNTTSPSRLLLNINPTGPTISTPGPGQSVVIEALRGAPGVQNLFVGPTPPNNPQEGWVWVDTSG